MLSSPVNPATQPKGRTVFPTKPDVFRVGIIGLGKIGKVHLANLKHSAQVEVAAISELSPAQCDDLPSEIHLCEDWRDVISSDEIDAVIITLPHSAHAECAMHALTQGKHVFLEKPLATTYVDAQALIRASREYDRTLMVNMTHRFYPPVRQARQMIREGLLGDVVSVRDHYMEVIDRSEFPAWFFDPVIAGGGVTMTDSIHLFDRVSWLLEEPLQIVGQASRIMDKNSLVEDCSEVLCRSASGIPVVVGSFFCFNSERTWGDNLTVYGTKGTLVIHAWSHLEWTPHGKPTQRFDGYASDLTPAACASVGHRAALEEFLSSIRENRIPESDGASVLNAQEIVQNFYDVYSRELISNA